MQKEVVPPEVCYSWIEQKTYGIDFSLNQIVEPVDKNLWGELESEEGWYTRTILKDHFIDSYDSVLEFEEEEEEEEQSEEEEEEEAEAEAAQEEEQPQPTEEAMKDGLVTPSGMASVASGLETPDFIELRKDVRKQQEEDEQPRQLYQVLPEVQKNVSGFMGSQHGYDLSTVEKGGEPSTARSSKRKMGGNVDVAIDPSELEAGLDESTLRAKYDAQMRSKLPAGAGGEDLSDMYVEHASRQAKKLKAAQENKKDKRKEFKF